MVCDTGWGLRQGRILFASSLNAWASPVPEHWQSGLGVEDANIFKVYFEVDVF